MESSPGSGFSPQALGLLVATIGLGGMGAALADMPNACPIDGCVVEITDAQRAGDEIELTFKSNFKPDVARNHFHVWWKELYDVKQVGRNAKSQFGVTQGKWHRHADYPRYITKNAASTSQRQGATTLCVTAADGGHNVLDPTLYDCKDVSKLLD